MEMPRQAICGPTHYSNRVLSVLNIGEGSKSTKTEQKIQTVDSEKKKSNSDIHQDGPQWLIWRERGRRDAKFLVIRGRNEYSRVITTNMDWILIGYSGHFSVDCLVLLVVLKLAMVHVLGCMWECFHHFWCNRLRHFYM